MWLRRNIGEVTVYEVIPSGSVHCPYVQDWYVHGQRTKPFASLVFLDVCKRVPLQYGIHELKSKCWNLIVPDLCSELVNLLHCDMDCECGLLMAVRMNANRRKGAFNC